MTDGSRIHATCVAVGEAGILITGASGAGKSSLALALIDDTRRRGGFARLVSDDRVCLEPRGGRLLARAHPAIAGKMEVRYGGIADVVHEEAVVVRLAIELGGAAPRLPAGAEAVASYCGIAIPCLRFPPAGGGIPLPNLHAAVEFLRTATYLRR